MKLADLDKNINKEVSFEDNGVIKYGKLIWYNTERTKGYVKCLSPTGKSRRDYEIPLALIHLVEPLSGASGK